MMITPAQCRAARGLLDWSQTELAERASIGRNTVVDLERERRTPHPNNLQAIASAFQKAGVEFFETDNGGVGVRLGSGSNNRSIG